MLASQDVFGFDSPPLHDSTAVAYVIDPSLFQVGTTIHFFMHTAARWHYGRLQLPTLKGWHDSSMVLL
jgi:inosine-uridine nucleoside N-ribohydrolase